MFIFYKQILLDLYVIVLWEYLVGISIKDQSAWAECLKAHCGINRGGQSLFENVFTFWTWNYFLLIGDEADQLEDKECRGLISYYFIIYDWLGSRALNRHPGYLAGQTPKWTAECLCAMRQRWYPLRELHVVAYAEIKSHFSRRDWK